MSVFKNTLSFVLTKGIWLLLLVIPVGYVLINLPSGCSIPTEYAIGRIDPRFNIPPDQVQDITFLAENIWEKPVGVNLFEYNPTANLTIHFVFDERQQAINDAKKFEKELSDSVSSIDQLENDYDYLVSLYDQQLLSYNVSLIRFEQREKIYNTKITFWNRKGGAPPRIYNDLVAEEENLSELLNQLNRDEQEINGLIDRINALSDSTNFLIAEHNTIVNTYNSVFGQPKEFNQGDYLGDVINVYQFDSTSDLQLVIAHELGHALGLDHVQNSSSLMYYLMQDQDLNSLQLSSQDIQELYTTCDLNS